MPKKISQRQVLKEAISVHGDRYGYSLFEYKGQNVKSKIFCKVHGIFEQSPVVHIKQKSGCPKCGTEDRIKHNHSCRLTTEAFVVKANKVHNNKYSYRKTQYINAREPVIITCLEHGDFFQRPTDHLHRNTGCPICAMLYKERGSGIGTYTKKLFEDNPDLAKVPGVLYLLDLKGNGEHFLKIGITKRTIRQRLWNMQGYQSKTLASFHLPLRECFDCEQKVLEECKDYKFYSNNKEFVGRTELFRLKFVDNIQASLLNVVGTYNERARSTPNLSSMV